MKSGKNPAANAILSILAILIWVAAGKSLMNELKKPKYSPPLLLEKSSKQQPFTRYDTLLYDPFAWVYGSAITQVLPATAPVRALGSRSFIPVFTPASQSNQGKPKVGKAIRVQFIAKGSDTVLLSGNHIARISRSDSASKP